MPRKSRQLRLQQAQELHAAWAQSPFANDWRHRFIGDMISRLERDRGTSTKQRNWLDSLIEEGVPAAENKNPELVAQIDAAVAAFEKAGSAYKWEHNVLVDMRPRVLLGKTMSEKQMNIHHDRFPFYSERVNVVLSSVFDDAFFAKVKILNEKYEGKKNNKWIVLGSSSWIKGVDDCKQWCEENNKEYELVWGLPYDELLEKLAQSEGLVFLPKGGDTCPRIVIEAKLLGCELLLNDNVLHKDEKWFAGNVDDAVDYLRTNVDRFWAGFQKTNDGVKKRLVIENEDKGCWNCMNLFKYFHIYARETYGHAFPLTYDNLHNKCNPSTVNGTIVNDAQNVQAFYHTWGTTPVFHWSIGKSDSPSEKRSHADYLDGEIPEFNNVDGIPFTIKWECEVKAKDKAIFKILNHEPSIDATWKTTPATKKKSTSKKVEPTKVEPEPEPEPQEEPQPIRKNTNNPKFNQIYGR